MKRINVQNKEKNVIFLGKNVNFKNIFYFIFFLNFFLIKQFTHSHKLLYITSLIYRKQLKKYIVAIGRKIKIQYIQ